MAARGEAMAKAKASKSKAKVAAADAAIAKALKAIAKEPACRCNNAARKHLLVAADWRGRRDVAPAKGGE